MVHTSYMQTFRDLGVLKFSYQLTTTSNVLVVYSSQATRQPMCDIAIPAVVLNCNLHGFEAMKSRTFKIRPTFWNGGPRPWHSKEPSGSIKYRLFLDQPSNYYSTRRSKKWPKFICDVTDVNFRRVSSIEKLNLALRTEPHLMKSQILRHAREQLNYR